MPRERSPERDKAFEMFRDAGGKITNREIANRLSIPEKTVGGWKVKDRWNEQLNGVLQTSERSTPKRVGAPSGNKNAVGNAGGRGGPVGNDKAVTHGFFRRIFPNTPEIHEILDSIEIKSPLEILWENIVIQYVAIVRAQQIMFVQDQTDETKVIKRIKDSEMSSEQEWEYQHAWDKHANFMQAQSRAMSTLESMLFRYEDMLPNGLKVEKQRLEMERIRADIDKIRNGGNSDEAEAWITALEGIAERRRKKRDGHGA